MLEIHEIAEKDISDIDGTGDISRPMEPERNL